ncbi:hypothetical protein GUITHDRAFT_155415, partial [Guillardia theta CCMP2712]
MSYPAAFSSPISSPCPRTTAVTVGGSPCWPDLDIDKPYIPHSLLLCSRLPSSPAAVRELISYIRPAIVFQYTDCIGSPARATHFSSPR